METDFKKHYDILDIHGPVDWATLQSTYRKLVNQWHPDRPHNANSDTNAELRFIELTKSYNALRDYYRKNRKLPDVRRSYQYSDPEIAEPVSLDERGAHWNPVSHKYREDEEAKRGALRNYGLAGAAILLLILSLGVLFILDVTARSKAAERARDVVNASEPSRFTASPDQVRRAEARGNFILADPLQKPLANQSKSGVLSQ